MSRSKPKYYWYDYVLIPVGLVWLFILWIRKLYNENIRATNRTRD